MKFIVFVLSLSFSNLSLAFSYCPAQNSTDPVLYASHFRWGINRSELLQLFELTYNRPERLDQRGYFDPATQMVVLPYYVNSGGAVRVGTQFIKAVQSHIEQAFQKQVIEGVFFPDMGHSHLLIPEDLFHSKFDKILNQSMSRFYEEVLMDDSVIFLYHTAEQLKFLDENNKVLDDPYSKWRFQTRNITGSADPSRPIAFLQNPDSADNTVNGLNGYRWWGAGFNLSANKQGCFTYRRDGKEFRFDVSLVDLIYPPDVVLY